MLRNHATFVFIRFLAANSNSNPFFHFRYFAAQSGLTCNFGLMFWSESAKLLPLMFIFSVLARILDGVVLDFSLDPDPELKSGRLLKT
jgi:hypothetical protein